MLRNLTKMNLGTELPQQRSLKLVSLWLDHRVQSIKSDFFMMISYTGSWILRLTARCRSVRLSSRKTSTCLVSIFLVANLAILSAETTQTQAKTISKKQTQAAICASCPPCDEPLPGTALWHYMKGIEELIGVRTNAYLANEHFKRAADMDYAPAIKALADSYYSGDGVDEDKHQALLLYVRAADLGDGAAQFNAGIILLRGYAGPQNAALAYYYLCLTTMNEGLDEMAQDAAIYRDEAGKLLTPEQLQDIYRKLVNNPATKPNKRSLKPGLNPNLVSMDQPPETPSTLSNGNQEPN